jgi:hypothetical protein
VEITDRLTDGVNHIGVEVVAYGRDWEGYSHYSNDCTLEDGLFIAEIEADGEVVSATGRTSGWSVPLPPALLCASASPTAVSASRSTRRMMRITCGSWATAHSFPPPPWSPSPFTWLTRLSCLR